MPNVETRVSFLCIQVLPVLSYPYGSSAYRAGIVDRVRVLVVSSQSNSPSKALVHAQCSGGELRKCHCLVVSKDLVRGVGERVARSGSRRAGDIQMISL